MNYSEIIFFDFVVSEVSDVEFCRIVAKRSSDEIFKRFEGNWISAINNPLISFFQWIDSIKKKDQNVILVIEGKFDAWNIEKWKYAFKDYGVILPEYIVFFSRLSLLRKIELIGWLLSFFYQMLICPFL